MEPRSGILREKKEGRRDEERKNIKENNFY